MNKIYTNQELILELKSIKFLIQYSDYYDEDLQFDESFHSINYNPNTYTFQRDINLIIQKLSETHMYDYSGGYIERIDENLKTIYVTLNNVADCDWEWYNIDD